MANKATCKTPIEPPEGAKLLTVPEAAYVLRSSVDLVYRLIAKGEIPSTRVGTKRFVTPRALADYLESHTTTRRPDPTSPAVPASIGLKESGLWNGKDY